MTRYKAIHTILFVALFACAGAQTTRKDLEEANDAFARDIRWSDLRGLGQRVAPDRQLEFSRLTSGSEESLKVTEYELQDVQASDDKAIVRSKVSWYREPSIVTKSGWMTIVWERKGSAWLITSIAGGPLPLPPLPEKPANPK